MTRLRPRRLAIALFMILAAAIFGAAPCAAAVAAKPAWDPTPRTAVISAFGPEMTALRAKLQGAQDHLVGGVVFTTGRLEGKPVLLFLSGISMVNAAMTTQMALDRFDLRRIVFSGIAGGVDPHLAVGDVVVPAQWGQYLEAVFAREKPGGYVLPETAKRHFTNFGMIFPQPVELPDGRKPPISRFWFAADPQLLALARSVAAKITLNTCTAAKECLQRRPQIIVGGKGVSGQAFVDNAAFRKYTWNTFGAEALDMESAAVADVATVNHTPFIIFRSLSDLAGGGPGANEMHIFMNLAADNSARLVLAFLNALPAG